MGVAEDYKLSMYQDYGPLGEKKHIRLVRNKTNGQICVKKIIDYSREIGFKISGLSYSPIKGPEGNIEYLLYLSKQDTDINIDDEIIKSVVDSSHNAL